MTDHLPDLTAADGRLRAALAKGARRLHLAQPIRAGRLYGIATTEIRTLAGDPHPIEETNRYELAEAIGQLRAAVVHGSVEKSTAIAFLDDLTRRVNDAIAEAEKTRP